MEKVTGIILVIWFVCTWYLTRKLGKWNLVKLILG